MKKVYFTLGVLFVLFLVSCSSSQTIYMCADGSVGGSIVPTSSKLTIVCPNGKEVESITACSFPNKLSISQKEAETKSINFVNGYVRTSGWSGTLINVYPQSGNFYGQVVVAKNGEQSYETVVEINGTTGSVSCAQNCVYLSQIN